jgi:hypothetical protein
MRRLATIAVIAGCAITGCSGSNDQTEPATSAAGTAASAPDTDITTPGSLGVDEPATTEIIDDTVAPATDPNTVAATAATSTGPSLDPVTEDDLVRFIAATEVPLKGTSLEGVVFDAPEIYIALAQAACARFSAGGSFDVIADGLLVDLATDKPTDDERLVGALIGAATRTICPEHADKI